MKSGWRIGSSICMAGFIEERTGRNPHEESIFRRRTDSYDRWALRRWEDKIVQQAVVTILNQIYEEDFKGFSYGFRPGRGPHQALDALFVAIQERKVNWVLDADIRDFFGKLSHEWTVKFVAHRVADRRI